MASRNSHDSARARRRRAGKAALSGGALVGGLAGPLLTAAPAHAAVFVVNSLADDGSDGTLRKEIQDANAALGADTITFAGAALTGTIELGPGQLEITESLTVTGPGSSALTVDANGTNRVFYVFPYTEVLANVTITGLKITGGVEVNGGAFYTLDTNLTLADVVITGNSADGPGGGVNFQAPGSFSISDSVVSGNDADGEGGGIYAGGGGLVTIARTVISGNTSGNSGGDGGGGFMVDNAGTLHIVDSVISGNTAYGGGGAYVDAEEASQVLIERTTISGNTAYGNGGGLGLSAVVGDALILDSTISGNHADVAGGGLYSWGSSDSLVTVAHSTVTGNDADYGGGLYNDGPVTLDHTIVAGNTAAYGGPDLLGGFDFAARFSLIGNDSDAPIDDLGGNIFNTPPQLGPLAPNGGFNQTHLPLPASPVLNAGDASFAPPPVTDQRGLPRVVGGRIDIGAVERQPYPLAYPGVVLSSTSWTLRDKLTPGPPTIGPFSYGTTPLVPIMGDWDGDGVSTPGVFKGGVFLLNNQNDNSAPEITFTFGDARGFPVVGDWDNNGKDEVAVFRNGTWQERSDTTATPASTPTYAFGPAAAWPAVWPVAGDWNGDGIDGIGTYVPATGTWSLRNTSDAGPPSITPFVYTAGTGTPRPGIVGDWDGDGDDTVGVRNGTTWYLNNQNDASAADVTFTFGGATPAAELPVVWGTP